MDMVAQAAVGACSVTGGPEGPPTRPGVTRGDAGPDVSVAGQFSESGEVFTLQVSGNFVEGDRSDDFMEIGIGVRK